MAQPTLPTDWERQQIHLLPFHLAWGDNSSTDHVDQPTELVSRRVYRAAFNAYAEWCINQVAQHPHSEGLIMTRRLLGWRTPPSNTGNLTAATDFIDERFFMSLDPVLASYYSLALRGKDFQAVTKQAHVSSPDVLKVKPSLVKKTKDQGKKLLSKVKRQSHAKPCRVIKDLATHQRSTHGEGNPVKALHNGTCGVCDHFRDCGNKQGRLPASIYRAIVLAHRGPSEQLTSLCRRIMDRQKHPDPPDLPLPSMTTDRLPGNQIEVQSSPQVADLPRNPEVRRNKKSRLFEVVNGVYTFVGTDEDMEFISRQDISGTFLPPGKRKRVRND
jgi:hypothetical protein